jgi:hypothetical protein
LITINVAAQTPVKLTSTNYLVLKLQFQTLFIEYDFIGFIDGSHPCPARTLQGTTTPNPAHTMDPTGSITSQCHPLFPFTHNNVFHCSSTNITGSMDNIG